MSRTYTSVSTQKVRDGFTSATSIYDCWLLDSIALDDPSHSDDYHTSAIMYLDKRDNMGYQVAPALIIFLVILGAGGMVVCGFAVMRFWGGDEAQDTTYMNRSVEQDRYMREVRERTWGKLPNYYVQQSNRSNAPTDGPSVKYVDACAVVWEGRLTICSASNTTYG
ncbi:hypothetical protein OPT61_g5515 [Boeremia exigua]|uniref:Uncharacterized protein n=1 Tax=Boeremia exigua TaxID=749465 RepID=A0ACC2IA14_9PLEO|nr:hypothetical protein OPT61_g5515 [Boeremia exigua]